jgi:acetylornithine deacetylase
MTERELLARLVAFRSVSSASNLDCIGFIRDWLGQWGIEAHVLPGPDGKANLRAMVGPAVPGGIVLSGHTDVVPVEGQAWTSDPWVLREQDGLLYGRGTCDMKGFVALAMMTAAKATQLQLRRPLHLAFSYDEEVGCKGVPGLIADLIAHAPLPAVVIVGEPSQMRVISGQKHSLAFHTHVTGHSVHSSQVHRGVSAVAVAARLITWFEDRMRRLAETTRDNGFDPPFTTLHCGMVQGGTAANIVAERCSFVTDVRAIPSDDALGYEAAYREHLSTMVIPAMRRISPAAGVEVVRRSFVQGACARRRTAPRKRWSGA